MAYTEMIGGGNSGWKLYYNNSSLTISSRFPIPYDANEMYILLIPKNYTSTNTITIDKHFPFFQRLVEMNKTMNTDAWTNIFAYEHDTKSAYFSINSIKHPTQGSSIGISIRDGSTNKNSDYMIEVYTK